MGQRPQPGARFRMGTLRRWNAVLWVLLGLMPPVIGAADESGAPRYGSLVLLAVLGLGYALLELFPGNRVLRPRVYLALLVPGMGALSVLGSGGAALYIVTLPQFWLFAASARYAVVLSGAAAAATVAGRLIHQGLDPELLTGNVVFTLIGWSAGVLLALWVHRYTEQSEEHARRLSAELDDAQLQLAEAHQRQGAAEERERLAREIHDTLAQGFASIVVLAEAARAGLETDPTRSAQQLRSIESTARENLAEARVLVGSAPRSGVASGSAARTLRRALDRFTEDTGVTVSAELPDVDCDQPTRVALLRCTQESLSNVRKHSGAASVGVVLARRPDGIELEITDDGHGFVVADARGFGLDGMRKRLAELGGELTVTSALGAGTRVLAVLPADSPGGAEAATD